MQPNKQQYPNRLDYYRRRNRFTNSHVAHLLGHRNPTTFLAYQRGERLPSLVNALRLGIILRVPIEFIFGALYDDMREAIRAEEERRSQPRQATLF
jgi:DNA-binding XRE family transcriptional regulator